MRILLTLLTGLLVGSMAMAEDSGAPALPTPEAGAPAVDAGAPPAEAAPEAVSAEDTPSRWFFALGVGGDLQWRREVNPDFGDFRNTPQAFGNVRFARWTLQLEWALDGERSSNAGAFRVTTMTTTFGSWARYDVIDWEGWRPFVSLGGGAHFDRVRTTFRDKVDERAASRRFLGLGGGISKIFWSHLLGELEGRVNSEEFTRGPTFALILRLGLSF